LDGEMALSFVSGYLVEESLSVDNLFVFLLIFTYFRVADKHQHRVLFWGIVGAVIMRASFIFIGMTALQKLDWLIYIFGAFLVYTGIRLSIQKDEEIKPEKNPVLRLFRKFVPMTKRYYGHSFTVKKLGHRLATPLLLVLVVIETTDVIFAVDSVPAILSITPDFFIAFTSNIFAILGLRSLYFALCGIIQTLRFLNYGLSAVLVFLGTKMLISSPLLDIHIPTGISLGVIAGILAISALASIIWKKKDNVCPPTGKE
jgi:tellurite resistance protein TerC